MTVKENLKYCLQSSKFPKDEVEKQIKDALEIVGLSGLEDRYPSQTSGGQQQRIALARNISYHPKVLPFSMSRYLRQLLDLQVRESK